MAKDEVELLGKVREDYDQFIRAASPLLWMLMAVIFSHLSAVLAPAAMLGGEPPQPLDPFRREP